MRHDITYEHSKSTFSSFTSTTVSSWTVMLQLVSYQSYHFNPIAQLPIAIGAVRHSGPHHLTVSCRYRAELNASLTEDPELSCREDVGRSSYMCSVYPLGWNG